MKTLKASVVLQVEEFFHRLMICWMKRMSDQDERSERK